MCSVTSDTVGCGPTRGQHGQADSVRHLGNRMRSHGRPNRDFGACVGEAFSGGSDFGPDSQTPSVNRTMLAPGMPPRRTWTRTPWPACAASGSAMAPMGRVWGPCLEGYGGILRRWLQLSVFEGEV